MIKIENVNIDDLWLNDLEKYSLIEKTIENTFIEVLNDEGNHKEDWIIPFFNTFWGSGEKVMDANPIFSAKNIPKNYIVRLIVYEGEDSMGYASYEDYFDDIPMITLWVTSGYTNQIKPFFRKAINRRVYLMKLSLRYNSVRISTRKKLRRALNKIL